MPKIDALYLYSSYTYVYIWFLIDSIKGTFATLFTNIVEASPFHLLQGVTTLSISTINISADIISHFSCHSAKCAIPPNLSISGLYLKYM